MKTNSPLTAKEIRKIILWSLGGIAVVAVLIWLLIELFPLLFPLFLAIIVGPSWLAAALKG